MYETMHMGMTRIWRIDGDERQRTDVNGWMLVYGHWWMEGARWTELDKQTLTNIGRELTNVE
jgi:hypothetical protein